MRKGEKGCAPRANRIANYRRMSRARFSSRNPGLHCCRQIWWNYFARPPAAAANADAAINAPVINLRGKSMRVPTGARDTGDASPFASPRNRRTSQTRKDRGSAFLSLLERKRPITIASQSPDAMLNFETTKREHCVRIAELKRFEFAARGFEKKRHVRRMNIARAFARSNSEENANVRRRGARKIGYSRMFGIKIAKLI